MPACFIGESAKEEKITWWAWSAAAARSDPGASSYCNDCQPWYQAEMIRMGLCDHPGTTFKRETSDGSVYSPSETARGLIGERPIHGKIMVDRVRFPVLHPEGKKMPRSNAAAPVRQFSEVEGGPPSAGIRFGLFEDIDTAD